MHPERIKKIPGQPLERGQVVYRHPELADTVTSDEQSCEPLGVVGADAAADEPTVLVAVGATVFRVGSSAGDQLVNYSEEA